MEQRIYLLRKKCGLSRQQLAEILHISASAEGMYEQGRRVPKLETLTTMAAIFLVSLDYLITGADFACACAPYTYDAPNLSHCCRCCYHVDLHHTYQTPCSRKMKEVK